MYVAQNFLVFAFAKVHNSGMNTAQLLRGVLSSFLLAACAAEPDAAPTLDALQVAEGEEAVVYGTDNRRDVYAETNAALRNFVKSSTVAMIANSAFASVSNSGVRFRSGGTYGSNNALCAGERFANHPDIASCSGTLVGTDLVLTAGHCVENNACASNKWVFNYSLANATTMTAVKSDDVYSCKRVEQQFRDDNGSDYAVVRLDRTVSAGHTPARVRPQTTTPVRAGQALVMAGSPAGLPTKITDGAQVLSVTTRGYFEANLDAFAGNSGSGVFDPSTFELVGILVRGNNDFALDSTRGCNVPQSCTAGSPSRARGCVFAGEQVSFPPARF